MLRVKSYKQSPSFCGPACLKMVLEYYGIKKSEAELAKSAKTSLKFGTSAKNVLNVGKRLGLKGFIKDYADINGLKEFVLKKKVPVIVNWFSQDEGHYSVVVGIDEKNIHLMDPEFGKRRTMDLVTFKRVWFDFHPAFLHSQKDLVIRRMIVLYK